MRYRLILISNARRFFLWRLRDFALPFQWGADTKDEVFQNMFYFMRHDSRVIQRDVMVSLGNVCVRHYEFMLNSTLKQLYIDILSEDFYSVQLKISVCYLDLIAFLSTTNRIVLQVLNNLEKYLTEEEIRMIKQDEHCKCGIRKFHV